MGGAPGPGAWTASQRSRGPLPRTGPPRSRSVPGPCGPGRFWSWLPRLRPRCSPGGSASHRRPGSGWSPRCPASGPHSIWTPRSPCRSAWRPTPRTRCAPGWPVTRRSAAGRAGSPSGRRSAPSRSGWPVRSPTTCSPRPGGTGAMARHHRRVVPAGPGPGHGDRAGPHAARRRRRRHGNATRREGRTSHAAAPCLLRRGPGSTGPGPVRRPGDSALVRSETQDQAGPGPDRAAVRTSTPLHAEIGRARLAASRLAASGSQVSRRALRNEGIRGSNQALNALAR